MRSIGKTMSKLKELPNFGAAETQQQVVAEIINWLHDQGYSVVVWTEDELHGTDVDEMEDAMIERGHEVILFHVDRNQ